LGCGPDPTLSEPTQFPHFSKPLFSLLSFSCHGIIFNLNKIPCSRLVPGRRPPTTAVAMSCYHVKNAVARCAGRSGPSRAQVQNNLRQNSLGLILFPLAEEANRSVPPESLRDNRRTNHGRPRWRGRTMMEGQIYPPFGLDVMMRWSQCVRQRRAQLDRDDGRGH
jgi:hypothetical protein